MAHHSPIRKETSSPAPAIPDKLYFRIGEVARVCEVPAYVLRFWEGEFPQLRPNKGGTGQRLYRRRDVEMALRIKGLLYDEGYTIPGARQLLKGEARQKEAQLSLVPEGPSAAGTEPLRHLRTEMAELLAMVSRPVEELGVAQGTRPEPQRRARVPPTMGPQRSEGLFDLGGGDGEDRKDDGHG